MSTELKPTTEEEDSHGRETPLVSFCQLLRRLQIESGKRVGYDLPPTEEPVRLRCDLTATFPINELAHWYADRQRWKFRSSACSAPVARCLSITHKR